MQLNNLYPLSQLSVYDAESGEIVVQIDRITILMTLEEFALVLKDFEDASKELKTIMMTTVQDKDYDQEIN